MWLMLTVGAASCSGLKSLGFRLQTMRSHCQIVKGVGTQNARKVEWRWGWEWSWNLVVSEKVFGGKGSGVSPLPDRSGK